MNGHAPRCACAVCACRRWLRYWPLEEHPSATATVKVARYDGAGGGGGEPDRAYDVVVSWVDLHSALATIPNPFLRLAAARRVSVADDRAIVAVVSGSFPIDWGVALRAAPREHPVTIEAAIDPESGLRRVQAVCLGCGHSWVGFGGAVTGKRSVDEMASNWGRAHASPLGWVLDRAAEAMAARLGPAFGFTPQRRAIAEPPPPEPVA